MGVIHGVDEDMQLISIERRKYLKHQSDRKYIRNKNRQNVDNQPTTSITVATPQRESIDNITSNGQDGGNFELVEMPESNFKSDEDRLFRQMFYECMNAYNRVCMRKEKSSPAYRPIKTVQWTTY